MFEPIESKRRNRFQGNFEDSENWEEWDLWLDRKELFLSWIHVVEIQKSCQFSALKVRG